MICGKKPEASQTEKIGDKVDKIGSRELLSVALGFVSKHFIFFAPAIYILGTVVICIRNSLLGLPFITISIVQYAILVFYMLLFIVPIIGLNLADKKIKVLIKNKNYNVKQSIKTYWQIIGKPMLQFGVTDYILLGFLIQDAVMALILVAVTYYFASALPNLFGNTIGYALKYLLQLCMCVVMLMQIPMTLGGLRGFGVEFCQNDDTEINCKEYVYYGEYDGLYQFRNSDTIILMPTDAGFIRYNKSKITSR